MTERYRHEVLYGRFVLQAPYPCKKTGNWLVKIRDIHRNVLIRKSTGTKDKRRAKQWALDFIEALLTAEVADEKRVEGVLLSTAWREWIATKQIREPTRLDYATTLNVLLAEMGEQILVHDVTFKVVSSFLSAQRAKHRTERTLQKQVTHLRGFFAWARRMAYTRENPVDGIVISKVRSRPGIALALEQAQSLLRACREPTIVSMSDGKREWDQEVGDRHHRYLAILIALYAGLRRRSILQLQWRHVDLQADRIDIPPELMKAGRAHSVPIHPILRRELLESMRSGALSSESRVIGREVLDIKVGFRADVKRSICPRDLTFHDLRHTFASLLSQWAPFAVLQRLLGHAPASVTLRYTHPSWESLVEAIGRLPDFTGTNGEEDGDSGESREKRAQTVK